MSTVRNIGTIMDLGSYKESKLNYNSLESLTKVVCNYVENSEYKDEKFNIKPKILQLNPTLQWDKCVHIKVKNRVPYIIEITTLNSKSYYISLYSKKFIKEDGYSHNYLKNILKELREYVFQNQDRERDVETIEKKVQFEINISLFALIFWLGVIILALNGKANLFKNFVAVTMVHFGLYMIMQGIKNIKK